MNRVYFFSFLFSLHIALSAYVNSSFLTTIISEKFVGILYVIASFITLVLLSKSSSLLTHIGNRRLTFWFLIADMASLLLLILSHNPYVMGIAFILLLISNTFIYLCLDIFVEHFGNPKTIGRTRGLFGTITNLAWMISPLITGFLINYSGYRTVYMAAFVVVSIMTMGLMGSIHTFKDKSYVKTPFLKTYAFLKKNRHIMAISVINFLLQFFFVVMTIYTPIYLHEHLGLSWSQIGVVFTIMLAPFVLFGLPVGILIDKYRVHKRSLISWGIVIAATATILISGFTLKSILFWGILLFMTRVGATLLETTSEIYFFTHVREQDAYLLSVFRDMRPVAYLVAPLLASAFLYFFPFKYLFIVLGIILACGLYYVAHLRHNHQAVHLD